MPCEWSDLFCLTKIPRDWLAARDVTSLINGNPLPSSGPLYVALTVLPIAWNWSFYIVQALHEHLISEMGFGTDLPVVLMADPTA